jgi:DNA polymerase III subunit epsilon
MGSSGSEQPLAQGDVLVVDCQATAAAPRGHLLEIGWGRAGTTNTRAEACLITMPDGERIPPAVARITGITDRMVRGGVEAPLAWRALVAAGATLTPQPAPTVIHFARFEQPFLCRLAGGVLPLDLVCTHAIATRLLPDLPRRSLRALAGYFGRAVGVLRRSADHVDATAFVWRELVRLLEAEGVSTWSGLKAWLAVPVEPTGRRRRVWPMPRSVRLALPDGPGVYRMLRTSGDVLYVGKASSLHHRVNSYFRHQHGVPERMLEMLSQARGISFEVSPTALEAALLEPDEIKRFRPPYNVALSDGDRQVWFAAPDLTEHSPRPSRRCRVGPFPSAEWLEQFAALAQQSRAALGRDRWAPDATTFHEGYARLRAAHVELSLNQLGMSARLLRLGTRLWREGRRDLDAGADGPPAADDRRAAAWTPEYVQLSLEWLAVRAALARRRAVWLTRLADASVAWREPGASQPRLIVIENGEIIARTIVDPDEAPPIPPGHRRSFAARHEAFTVARFDRLRVLSTELKRLVSAGAPVAVRFGASPPIADARLASLLAWL